MSLATLLPDVYKEGADLLFVIDPYHIKYDHNNKPYPSVNLELSHIVPLRHALKTIGATEANFILVDLPAEAKTDDIRKYREILLYDIDKRAASRIVVMSSRPAFHQVLFDELSDMAFNYLDKINEDWRSLYPSILSDKSTIIKGNTLVKYKMVMDGYKSESMYDDDGNEKYVDVPNLVEEEIILGHLFSIDEPMNVWDSVLKQFFHKIYMTQTKEARKEIAEQRPQDFIVNNFNNLRTDHGNFFRLKELPSRIVIPSFGISHFYKVISEYSWEKRQKVEKKVPYLSPEQYNILHRDIERAWNFEEIIYPKWEMIDFDTLKFNDSDIVIIDLETRPNTSYMDVPKAALEPELSTIMLAGIKGFNDNITYVLPNPSPDDLSKLYDILERDNCALCFHNATFDLYQLSYNSGFEWQLPIYDTMLMAYLANEPVLSLKHLSTMYTMLAGSHTWGSFESFEYLAEDVWATQYVFESLIGAETTKTPAFELVHNLIKPIVRMQLNGLHIDVNELKRQLDNAENLENELEKQVYNSFWSMLGVGDEDKLEFNLRSNQDLADMLLLSGATLKEKTRSGQWSVTKSIMKPFREFYDWVDAYMDLNEIAKVSNTFLSSFYEKVTRHPQHHGILHPKFNLTGTDTGRLSSSDPNGQNIPSKGFIKTIFTSRFDGGVIGSVDLSGAELNMGALLTQDKKMQELLSTTDLHRYGASLVYSKPMDEITPKERGSVKSVLFGTMYGGTPRGLAYNGGMEIEDVQRAVDMMVETFPDMMQDLDNSKEFAVRHGYIETPLGRRRSFKEELALNLSNKVARQAFNTKIQSMASDLNLQILYNIHCLLDASGLQSMIVLTVHDSIILDIHPDEIDRVVSICKQAYYDVNGSFFGNLPDWGQVEFKGDLILGKSWAACEDKNPAYNPIAKYECSTWEIK